MGEDEAEDMEDYELVEKPDASIDDAVTVSPVEVHLVRHSIRCSISSKSSLPLCSGTSLKAPLSWHGGRPGGTV